MSSESTVVNSLMSLAQMPKEEIKRAMDRSFLANLVRKHPTLEQSDFIEFINKCQLTGADPRLNQVYLLVHNSWNADKRAFEPKGTTVFAYQFFIQMAQRTRELEDFGVDTVIDTYMDLATGKERKSITSNAWVKRRGTRYEYKARFWEFAKTNKEGNLMKNWASSPYLMLEKCAIANVMRWAFPESLTGIYTHEEITKDGNDPIATIMPVKTTQTKPQLESQKMADSVTKREEILESKVEEVNTTLSEMAIEDPKKKEEPKKVDFSGRDIEDLRGEIVDFLKDVEDSLFQRIGKTREYMIEKVESEKSLDGMKQKYSIIMRFM